MRRAGVVTCLLLLLAGCSSSTGSGGSSGGSSGSSGSTGGGHACSELDAGCSVQASCGESRGSVQLYACVAGRCQGQAVRDATCNAVEPLVQVQANVDSTISTATIASFKLRALYPFRGDGSAVGCADVVHQPDLADGGNGLDADPLLQFENVGAYPAVQASHTVSMNVTLVGASRPVLLVQAYSGGQGAGQRIAEGCAEGTPVAAYGDGGLQIIDIAVSP